jgi:hypothetical protein
VSAPADNARVQAIYRQVNEGIALINAGWSTPRLELLCECGTPGCTERVELTADEYEAVRAVPTHFVLRPRHDDPDTEHVVRTGEGWVIVENDGLAAEIARRTDPRTHAR